MEKIKSIGVFLHKYKDMHYPEFEVKVKIEKGTIGKYDIIRIPIEEELYQKLAKDRSINEHELGSTIIIENSEQ